MHIDIYIYIGTEPILFIYFLFFNFFNFLFLFVPSFFFFSFLMGYKLVPCLLWNLLLGKICSQERECLTGRHIAIFASL